MDGQHVRTGGCLCGAVRYQLRGEPYVAGLCHCATCRKLTGAPFVVTANWHAAQFTLSGTLATYERRSFCPACGARLFFLFDGGVEVFLGTFDDAPNGIAPLIEVWTSRREHWLPPIPGVVSHLHNPEDP